jgi:hypothetical protein
MDYNFASCVLWFLSMPWLLKAVAALMLGLAVTATALVVAK